MKCTIDIMVDIETLGVADDAQIVQISAGAFHIDSIVRSLEDMITFNETMDLSTIGGTLSLEQKTLDFWTSSNEHAKVLNRMLRVDSGVTEEIMVRKFYNWLQEFTLVYNEVRLWGNGIIFDNVKIDNLFAKYGLKSPIKFYNHRDVRTIVDLASDKVHTSSSAYRGRFAYGIERHNAMDDVLYQARYVTSAYSDLMKYDNEYRGLGCV